MHYLALAIKKWKNNLSLFDIWAGKETTLMLFCYLIKNT